MHKEKMMRWSMFLLRVVAGLLFFQHGAMKLLGWFGGSGDLSTLMMVAGVIELVGGLLVLLGLFTRPVAFILAGEMAVAYFMAHFPTSIWPIENGGEPAALFCFIFLFFAFHGAGAWSLDSKMKRHHH